MNAGGRLIVIDGGFCSAYQKYTGIAGYTMFFSSHGIRISAHQPWGGVPESVRRGADITSDCLLYTSIEIGRDVALATANRCAPTGLYMYK